MAAIRDLQQQQAVPAQRTINEPISDSEIPVDEAMFAAILESGEMRAESRSRLVIRFSKKSDLTVEQQRAIDQDPALSGLIGSQYFVLDESGVLALQGLQAVPLLGLDEEDIERRLAAEPYLENLNVDVRILSQKAIGVEALQPFGYEVFDQTGVGLDAPSAGPVPADYVLGPGDSIRVQLFGNVNDIYEYEVTRDGVLNLPEIGPVNVAGIRFSEFRQDLRRRVDAMLIGTQVSVTMGQLRTIRIFVLGDVNRPGSYVVSGLATISTGPKVINAQ